MKDNFGVTYRGRHRLLIANVTPYEGNARPHFFEILLVAGDQIIDDPNLAIAFASKARTSVEPINPAPSVTT
jgi:hypothetical protein